MRGIRTGWNKLCVCLMILSLFLMRPVQLYAIQSDGQLKDGQIQDGQLQDEQIQDGQLQPRDSEPAVITPGWEQSGELWRYRENDGSYAVQQWKQINGSWYYFDKDGRMATGWQQINKNVYYLKSSGAMATGWQQIDKTWYYFDESGAMRTNWQKVGGVWYYLDGDGKMQTGWQKVGGVWYYLDESGKMVTGWQKVGGVWYYLDTSGRMLTGWQWIGGKCYYLRSSGAMAEDTWIDGYYVDGSGAWIPGRVRMAQWMKSGSRWWYQEADGSYPSSSWKLIGGAWYYFDGDGWMATGWQKVGKATYYLKSSGAMATGWQQIDKIWYYFSESGAMQTDWQKIGKVWYYLNRNGEMQTGWQQIGGVWYYLEKSGAMATGWKQIGGVWYYLMNSGRMAVGWQKIGGTWYYLSGSGAMVTGWQTIGGSKYYFDKNGAMASNTTVDGILLNASGQAVETEAGTGTVKGLLQTALLPVGQTMYIYGGGHDGSEGGDAVRIGVNPQWKEFYSQQDKNYDFTQYRYKHGYGLDCSGLVGWSVYNTLNTKPNQQDFSSTSTLMPQFLADKGLGTCSVSSGTFTPGDVVSKPGHTWIVLGMCEDGSAVIIHSTPPVVQISGTVSADGKYNSQAVELARTYMKRYYADAASRFNLSTGDKTYLNNVSRFRWSSGILSDPDGLRSMDAGEILKKIFGE